MSKKKRGKKAHDPHIHISRPPRRWSIALKFPINVSGNHVVRYLKLVYDLSTNLLMVIYPSMVFRKDDVTSVHPSILGACTHCLFRMSVAQFTQIIHSFLFWVHRIKKVWRVFKISSFYLNTVKALNIEVLDLALAGREITDDIRSLPHIWNFRVKINISLLDRAVYRLQAVKFSWIKRTRPASASDNREDCIRLYRKNGF